MKRTPEQAAAQLAGVVERLKQAGVSMPIEALEAGVQAAASTAAYDAARRKLSSQVRVTRSANGVRLIASGRGARVVAASFRRDVVRRLPEVRRLVRADLLRKLR